MGFLEDVDTSTLPTIPEFYKGKTIFVTGGSGFMGLTLIEKLLYSCSDLARIYVLLRTKKGQTPDKRLGQMYESLIFERLKKEKPNIFKEKVFFIGGDVTEPGLGMSKEDRQKLASETDIVFHAAASVRFDDSLPYAVNMNLRGTIEVLELAKEMKKLCSIVHVSTCYANCNRYYVEEQLYPPLADYREILEICSEVDEQTLDVMTRKILGDMPNTYVFTKQLAEQVVYEYRDQLPLVMIRPSIVINSLEEPFPGWLNNFNGPAGILVACGKGIMRSIYAGGDLVTDFIPVDVSIKNFIAAAWLRGATKYSPKDELPIYNCAANKLLEIKMQELVDVGRIVSEEYPLNDILWYPGFSISKCKAYHYIKVLLLQIIPALLVDTVLWLIGKKTLLLKIQRRIYQANIALGYFLTHEWKFSNDNFIALRSRIKEEDKKEFFYTIENVDKYDFFVKSNFGGRRCVLKDKKDIETARSNLFKFKILDFVVKVIFFSYLFWRIYNSYLLKY